MEKDTNEDKEIEEKRKLKAMEVEGRHEDVVIIIFHYEGKDS